jgi:hypothetical protein
VIAADLAVQGTDEESVKAQQADQQVPHRSAHRPGLRGVDTEDPLQTTVEIRAEFLVRRLGCGRESTHDQGAPGGEVHESRTAQVTETALDTVADDGVPDGTADDEAHAREPVGLTARLDEQVDHERAAPAPTPCARDQAQVIATSETMLRWEHGREGTGPVEP